ncbi:bifunctional biotin--[acetyl-CoA-carboxylase] ligase/biotin operon repressor BirA [Thalassomonas actiniarum]|uniref:Bifunctional ligase/repressor BirA n=1 Tax=Thalassomonas actiniarum TaxID=485447 RepID=A0AAE9YSN4_9GAMM|nr:bifunctional biotin--[acetyl-CoA-carboxylase] ligase/biotin operon repressor BirA [Thalassomonas actiniarum]WDD98777.1 bifunctional biotin--[acetyl-CoA-carboxylase] synthetase/biotin operon repressor [Thalassomonas actiniarum]
MAKSLREDLIRKLANGEFVSGEALGQQFGVSRAAVSKHINALADMGLDIFRVSGKGYKLARPLDLLSNDKIREALAANGLANTVEVHNLIDSTNSYLLRRLPNNLKQGQVCIAEYQSAGRGRRGRQWISPFGSHIYLSMYWQLEQGMSAAMGLSLVTALAVSDAISELLNIEVQLKWPNDIYLSGVKLAGILIDLEGQALGACHSVIGIGLNLAMPEQSAAQVDQPWTDLKSHTQAVLDRNMLCSAIIKCLTRRLEQHQAFGLTPMVDEWLQQDFYLDKPVKLITGERVTSGICRGINNQGALLLETGGQVKAIYGGEVSLRADDDRIS